MLLAAKTRLFKRKRSNKVERATLFDAFNILLMLVICIVCLYPMLYIVFASFSMPSQLALHRGIMLWPQGFTLEGYRLVLNNPNILSGYMNTLIYVVFGTAMDLIMTTMAAFLVSRTRWMWARGLTIMILVNMFFGGGLIPFYMLIRDLGWLDTRLALIVPGSVNVFRMIITRTAIQAIPDSLEESARIDGASDFTILIKIVLPLITAALAVQVLFSAVANWNAWFNAMIFIRDRSLIPLQLILREIWITDDMQTIAGIEGVGVGVVGGMTMADLVNLQLLTRYVTVVVATLPILCAYPFLQKYFVKGMLVGAVKG
jgi:putative aldouronate transport system permease protein